MKTERRRGHIQYANEYRIAGRVRGPYLATRGFQGVTPQTHSNSQSLLAVFCPKDLVKEEPFVCARQYLDQQLQLALTVSDDRRVSMERSCDVGPRGWSCRMKAVKKCVPEKDAFHVAIATVASQSPLLHPMWVSVFVGIGSVTHVRRVSHWPWHLPLLQDRMQICVLLYCKLPWHHIS